jgi:hypothetical protein
MITEADLKKNEDAAALVLANPKDFPAHDWDAARVIADLCSTLRAAKLAADSILAPMTMEVGRLMFDAPDEEITLIAYGDTIKIPASKFNALYRATDF